MPLPSEASEPVTFITSAPIESSSYGRLLYVQTAGPSSLMAGCCHQCNKNTLTLPTPHSTSEQKSR